LADRGSKVHWGVDDGPGFSRLIGVEYRHGITAVFADLTQLTADDFAMLSRLPELESLQIYGFRDNGLGRRLTEDHLQQVRQIPSLRSLILSENEIVAPALEALQGHPSLRSLTINAQMFENEALAPLAGIPNLRYLSLHSPQLDDSSLVHIANCHQLEDLYVYYGMAITDAGLAPLAGLRRLSSLTLCGVPITDAGLADVARIESLTSLDLTSTRVTDAGVQHLHQLKQLRTLVLHETAVTAGRISQLENEIPNLHVSQ
jgi:hypothetical protein